MKHETHMRGDRIEFAPYWNGNSGIGEYEARAAVDRIQFKYSRIIVTGVERNKHGKHVVVFVVF